MKIRDQYKVREIACEHVVIMQGRYGADMTRVISLNESALFLWNELQGREFAAEDAARLLTERYGIGDDAALRDARRWVATLEECKLVE